MRVVVVDPSRTVLKAVSRLLAAEGHEVVTFVDGPEALAFIKSDLGVDAVITSAELPTISGIELCWETRLLAGHGRAIYVILMSSNPDRKQLINALDSGADEFIGKPPAKEELYARLRSAERLIRLQRELIRLAMNDPLTGLWNRRAFFEKAQETIARADGANRTIAIMFDVDHFKRVNDTYGHDSGDQVLQSIAEAAASACGKDAHMIVGRLGGEEFAIVLEGITLEAGTAVAESLREKVAALAFSTRQGRLTVTCSLGVSAWQAGESIDQLLKHADMALYQAKAGGRNCVVVAGRSAPATDAVAGSGVVRSAVRGDPSNNPSTATTALEAAPPSIALGSVSTVEHRLLPASAYVLDDEPQIATVVGKVLSSCGVEPRQFTAAEPFLAALEEAPPDLIVLDLALGQSDAVEIIRDLEILKYRGEVLLISGRDAATLAEIAQIGERHGLQMLEPLRKPFRAADLKRRLAAPPVGARVATASRADEAARSGRAAVSLTEALHNDWLEVWYQPKIDLRSLQVCGAEALVRARHPVNGLITPAHFLPPAGDPAYEPLSRFVIARTMTDWQRFADQGLHLRLSVNVPASVMHAQNFIPMLRSLLPAHPAFPGLILEITEDEVIRDPKWARETATQLKLYNVGISIDDFGSAYASLSRLSDLPVVEVKIDRSFVAGCSADRLKQGLCQTVVDLAHRFGATACAEGVETREDLHALMAMQCDSAQGFLFAKPMSAVAFAALPVQQISHSISLDLVEADSDRARLAQPA
jgi:diguanylate cyclase (GGDEF)-like protein